MAKTNAMRSAAWRRRLLLKSTFFDDLNTDRAARIRQAFPGDNRPEVRAVVEFFANYPRCQSAPRLIDQRNGVWCVYLQQEDNYEAASALLALREVTSMPIISDGAGGLPVSNYIVDQVRDEVAEMRALGLWGRS